MTRAPREITAREIADTGSEIFGLAPRDVAYRTPAQIADSGRRFVEWCMRTINAPRAVEPTDDTEPTCENCGELVAHSHFRGNDDRGDPIFTCQSNIRRVEGRCRIPLVSIGQGDFAHNGDGRLIGGRP